MGFSRGDYDNRYVNQKKFDGGAINCSGILKGNERALRDAEEAVERATEKTHQLLPNGLQTKNHYFFSAHDDELGSVGIVWYAIMDEGEGKSAFIYDIEIQEQYRSRGFGTQTLHALEEAVRPLGVRRIKLHVFGHNEGAFRLYRRLGFVPTNISMVKVLATKISGEGG